MYYPYLRGRQNELLCIRELLAADKLGTKIIPVIEPVKFSSTYIKTIEKFVEKEKDIIIIMNPLVGDFWEEYSATKDVAEKDSDEKKQEKAQKVLDSYDELLKNKHIKKAYIVNNTVVEKIKKQEINVCDSILINLDSDSSKYYDDNECLYDAPLTFLPTDMDFDKEAFNKGKVFFRDFYEKAARNSDYIKKPDSVFTKAYFNYDKQGYAGISDFSIVGNNYETTGFAPLAVAIHIVYPDKNKLNIHHFVSESNKSISDPALKFQEAMQSMINWDNYNKIPKTLGLNTMIDCYNRKKFPNLGSIKKYSIMHHIEIVADVLAGANL